MATTSEHVIRLRADASQFRRSFDQAQRKIGGFTKGLGALGGMMPGLGLAGGGFALFSKVTEFADRAEQLRNMNRQTGISIEMLQQLDFVAKNTGLQLTDLSMAWMRVAELQERARRGQKETIKNLEAVGISGAAFGGASTEAGFKMMTQAAATASLGAVRVLLPELGPRLRQAAAQDIPGLMGRAPVISTAAIERAATIGDELTAIRMKLDADIAPTLLSILEAVRFLARIPTGITEGAGAAGRMSVAAQGATGARGGMLDFIRMLGGNQAAAQRVATQTAVFENQNRLNLDRIAAASERSAAALTEES